MGDRARMGLDQPAHYRIEVQGWVSERWAEWVNGMAMTHGGDDSQPVTTLAGVVIDQAAVSRVGLDADRLAALVAGQQLEVARRAAGLRSRFPRVELRGAAAVVVDDGLATGATAARKRAGPARASTAEKSNSTAGRSRLMSRRNSSTRFSMGVPVRYQTWSACSPRRPTS